MKNGKLKFLFACFVAILGIYSLFTAPFLMPLGLGAVILNGILGGGRNKVGPVIMSKWKGIDYIKKYFIPSNPNTPAQQAARAKFAALVVIAQKLLTNLIPFAWDPFAVKMTGFNDFFRINYSLLDVSNKLQATSIMSKGTLEPVDSLLATYTSVSGVVEATWGDTINGNGLATDNVSLIIYDKVNNLLYADLETAARQDTTSTFTIRTGLTATNVICWAFCSRGTGSDFVVSNSLGDVAST